MSAFFLGIDLHYWAYGLTFLFAMASNIISGFSIYRHYKYPHKEDARRHIIRILLMVNIYAVECWFSLVWTDSTIYLNCIRDFWEAIVIYEFYSLIIVAIGGYRLLVDDMNHHRTSHLWPLNCCCQSLEPENLVFWTKFGTLQYCLCQVVMTFIIFSCQVAGVYNEGSMKPNHVYPYIAFIISLSQSWAIYCLVMFYHSLSHLEEDTRAGQNFKSFNAFSKFCAIKGVVFFIFWQGLALNILVFYDVIKRSDEFTKQEISSGIQDCLVSIEMLGFAIAHCFVFNQKDFETEGRISKPRSLASSVVSGFDVRDIAKDINSYVFMGEQPLSGGKLILEKRPSDDIDYGATSTDPKNDDDETEERLLADPISW